MIVFGLLGRVILNRLKRFGGNHTQVRSFLKRGGSTFLRNICTPPPLTIPHGVTSPNTKFYHCKNSTLTVKLNPDRHIRPVDNLFKTHQLP